MRPTQLARNRNRNEQLLLKLKLKPRARAKELRARVLQLAQVHQFLSRTSAAGQPKAR